MPVTQDNTMNNDMHYNVDVFGDYFTTTSMGNIVKPFGVVTLKMREWTSCQMLARKHILPTLIKKADPEYKDIRRCIVIGVKTHDGHPVHGLPIKYMSREQIAMECRSQNIPLRTDIYPDIVMLRNKLKFARIDPEKFIQQEQKTIRAFDKIGDALSLNANVFDDIKNRQQQDVKLLNNPEPADDLETMVVPTSNIKDKDLPPVEVTGGDDGSKDHLNDEDFNI